MNTLYREDLAHIHVDGYGFHWTGAADAVLDWLTAYGINSGTVVDLGCGGGQWLARLQQAGHETVGIDVSETMVAIAKENAPAASLHCGSFDQVTIPSCDAATSLGEPLNYLGSAAAIRRTMRNVFKGLRPEGVFIFDVRHPAAGPVPPRDHHRVADDWFCYARVEEDHRRNSITRQITSFRRMKDGTYRRDEETHRLKVFPRSVVALWLRNIGFRVRTFGGYGDYKLGPRQSVFVCRKPAN